MTKKHVLIIDDDDDLRRAAARALEDEGFEIAQADSVRAGLRLLESQRNLRVIVLDLYFPDKEDGSVLLDKLKKRASNYRIIVYTAYIERLKADKAIDLHVYAYVPKGGGALPAGRELFTAERLPSAVEPLKFAINQALKDLEAEQLRNLIEAHREIQEVINSPKPGVRALQLVCKHLVKQIGGYTCHIRLLDMRKGDYELVAYHGPAGVNNLFMRNKRLKEPFSGEVAKSGKGSLYQNIQENSTFIDFRDAVLREPGGEKFGDYFRTIKAAYIVPVKTRLFDNPEQVDAVVNISGAEENFFTPERVKTMAEFLTDANLAVSKSWLEEKRGEIHNDYKRSSALLVEVSANLQQANLNQIFDLVLQRIAEIISPEMISLFIYNDRTGQVRNCAEFVGNRTYYDRDESYAPGESLTGNVFKEKKPLLINDEPTEHRFYAAARKEVDTRRLPSRQIKHYLAVPLTAGDEVIGVIRAVNKKSSYYDKSYPAVTADENCLLSRGFSRDCQVILGIIASHLAVTIKNSELIGQLKERVNQLDALANVGQRISANYGLETKDLLSMIVEETAMVMNAAICMHFEKDAAAGRLILKQSQAKDLIPSASYGLDEDYFTPRVAVTGEPVIVDKAEQYTGKFDAEILKFLKEQYGDETKITSFMIAPIKIVQHDSTVREHNVIGVLKVINKKSGNLRFDANDLRLFKTFASQISVALVMAERNRSLFRLVQGVGHEIENSVAAVVPNAKITIGRLNALAGRVAAYGDPPAHAEVGKITQIVTTIYDVAREAQDFTDDLLGFSDRQFRERKRVDLRGLIQQEVNRLRDNPPPSVKNVEEVDVDFDFWDEPLACEIYEKPFAHVIRNIIANAYQAMEKMGRGRLTIRARPETQKKSPEREIACVEITDTGKGIEPEDIGKVFHSDFSLREGGNGLGLWLVKLSLLRMDGDISVESVVGAGSTFKIELPMFGPKFEAQANG